LVKFGREASYHMWSSKLWGIVLFAAFFSLLALGSDNRLVDAAIYLGSSSIWRAWRSRPSCLGGGATCRASSTPSGSAGSNAPSLAG
jgi:hypothetical protein